VRKCDFCAKPLKTEPNGRKKFCDGRCRQAAYMSRLKNLHCPSCGHRLTAKETREALSMARREESGRQRPASRPKGGDGARRR